MTIREIIAEFEEYLNRVHIVLIPAPALEMYNRLKELEKEIVDEIESIKIDIGKGDHTTIFQVAMDKLNNILGPEVKK